MKAIHIKLITLLLLFFSLINDSQAVVIIKENSNNTATYEHLSDDLSPKNKLTKKLTRKIEKLKKRLKKKNKEGSEKKKIELFSLIGFILIMIPILALLFNIEALMFLSATIPLLSVLIGSLVFSIIGYFRVKKNEKYNRSLNLLFSLTEIIISGLALAFVVVLSFIIFIFYPLTFKALDLLKK